MIWGASSSEVHFTTAYPLLCSGGLIRTVVLDQSEFVLHVRFCQSAAAVQLISGVGYLCSFAWGADRTTLTVMNAAITAIVAASILLLASQIYRHGAVIHLNDAQNSWGAPEQKAALYAPYLAGSLVLSVCATIQTTITPGAAFFSSFGAICYAAIFFLYLFNYISSARHCRNAAGKSAGG